MAATSAARLLLEHKFGCLPVIERGALVGVVTEIDFLAAFLAASKAQTQEGQSTPSVS
jgi:CBS domain-containing membrane protein